MNHLHQRPDDIVRTFPRRCSVAPWLAILLVILVAACGSNGETSESRTTNSAAAPASVDAEPQNDTAGVGDTSMVSATEIAHCLADAGYETTSNDELLTNQQRDDLESIFGQVDGLTFSGISTFSGEIAIFATTDQAAQRADQLRDTALVLLPVGPALISIAAGTGYEAHIGAAEACLV